MRILSEVEGKKRTRRMDFQSEEGGDSRQKFTEQCHNPVETREQFLHHIHWKRRDIPMWKMIVPTF